MSGHVQEEYPLVGGYGETRSKWFYVGAIVFVCWNILLFSLAVAAIAKVNDIKDPKQPEPVIFSQSVSASVNGTVPVMNVVSMLPNGSVRNGAGTTIYSKPNTPFGVGSQNVRVARFIDQFTVDYVIAVWTNNTGSFAVLGTISLDKETVSGWLTPVKLPFDTFYDVITLANNHFIIAADKAVWAGSVSNLTALSSRDYSNPVWRDIRLTALGPSTFVVSYDTGFISVDEGTDFGAVVGNVMWDMVNKLPNVTWVSNVAQMHGNFPVHDVFALSGTTFVVAYGASTNVSKQLVCSFLRYNPDAATLAISSTASFDGISPEFHLSAVGLDSSTGAIVVVDSSKDYALRAVLVHRTPYKIDGLHFGDVLTIEDGVADSTYTNQFKNGVLPFIDSASVSASKIVVAWADYSNSGKLTTAIVSVDQAANLHSSPLYVIGQALSLDQLNNYSISVAGLSIEAFGQYGAVVIERKSATDAASSGNVALVEVAPKAFGVASHNAFSGQTAQVVVSGLVTLPSSFPNLEPGYLYYGRTDGSLKAGPLAGTIDKSAQFITLSDGSIVTVDSAVGLAVNKRQLYVLPSF